MESLMEQPLVTIVTVTYNAEDLLEDTILSVVNQSYKNIEYIIIDGASTDKSVDIIKKYEDQIDYWISEPDEGIYFAMNKAVEKATGKWINFMNAGDSFANDTTIELVMEKVDNDTELIYGDYLNSKREFCTVEHRQNILRSMPCCHQSLYVRTKLMKEDPFKTLFRISADYDFILRMYNEGKKFKYIMEPLCVYLEGGLSQRDAIRRELETFAIYMNNQVDIDNIISSSAYENAIKRSSFYQEKIAHIKHQDEWIKKVRSATKELSSIKFLVHPVEKIKHYKKLMVIMHGQKK